MALRTAGAATSPTRALGQVISLGSVGVDVEVRADGWPAFGETLLGSDFLMAGGGKAANVAYLARRLDAPTILIGHVGDDLLRAQALRSLQAAGVDLSGTRIVDGCPTGFAMVLVRKDGDKAIVAANNANDAWTPPDADDVAATIAHAPARSVLVADIEIPAFVVLRAVEAARQRTFTVILDPSRTERMVDRLYPLVDYLTPNPSEAQQLTGIRVGSVEEAIRAGRVLVERGVGTAMVKLAHGGCVVVGPHFHEHVTVAPHRAVDTTGAGDAFAGALAVALLEGRPTIAAARFAAAAARLAVLSYGAQPSYPTYADLERWPTRS